jgi:hypothetical protein
MKRILTNSIITPNKMPLTKYGLDMLQDAPKIMINTLVKNRIIGADDDGKPHFLLPINSGALSGDPFTIEDNLIYVSGNTFYLPSATYSGFTIDDAYLYLDTFYDASNPVRFTDGTNKYVYQNNEVLLFDNSVQTAPTGHTYTLIGYYGDCEYAPEFTLQSDFNALTAVTNGLQTAITYNHGLITGLTTNSLVKYIEIGPWVMSADTSVTVAHGTANVIDVSVSIKNDALTEYRQLNDTNNVTCSPQGGWRWDGTNVILTRLNAGNFDSSNFGNSTMNRGYITLTYRTS